MDPPDAGEAAQDNPCPAPECHEWFYTMDGLWDHIEREHGGKSLHELRQESERFYAEGDDE